MALYYRDHLQVTGRQASSINVDEDGYSTWQAHVFMTAFGGYLSMGMPDILDSLDILICDRDLEDAPTEIKIGETL